MNTSSIRKIVADLITAMPDFDESVWVTGNDNFTTNGRTWHRLSIQSAPSRIVGMADTPIIREIGAVVVQIFTPLDSGDSVERADEIARHLSCVKVGKLELLSPTVTDLGSDGNFYQTNVRIPYRHN